MQIKPNNTNRMIIGWVVGVICDMLILTWLTKFIWNFAIVSTIPGVLEIDMLKAVYINTLIYIWHNYSIIVKGHTKCLN